MLSTVLAYFASSRNGAAEATRLLEPRVRSLQREMTLRLLLGSPVSIGWISEKLRGDLSDQERRIAAFSLVRDIPYKLTAWSGDPDSLFVMERGDCRHKSAALIALMRACEAETRPVQVVFDWADLPIPKSVLEPLAETRSFHDTLEVRIDSSWILVDPTWDPSLAKAGFPVVADWNGADATLHVTPHATTVIRRGDFKAGTDLYTQFGIGRPERARTLAFNRAFNAWADKLRQPGGIGGDAD